MKTELVVQHLKDISKPNPQRVQTTEYTKRSLTAIPAYLEELKVKRVVVKKIQ